MDGPTTTGWPVARPVFSDPTGARWRHVVLGAAAVFVLAAGLVAWSAPAAFAPVWSASRNTGAGFPRAALAADGDLPVVGDGVFTRIVRVVRAGGRVDLADPFSDTVFRGATADEVTDLGGHAYAEEHFGAPADHTLALTFDDGPSAPVTPQLLDVLDREHVPATFFMVGQNAVRHADVVQRMVREGHAVGDHTFTHIRFEEHNSARDRAELVSTDRLVRAAAGYGTRLFRMPYGEEETSPLAVLTAQQLGYLHCGFDVDTYDWRYHTGDHIPVPTLDGRGHVVLLHDGGGDRAATLELTQRLIEAARRLNYRFVTVASFAPAGYPSGHVDASRGDRATWWSMWGLLVLPGRVVDWLFWFGVSSLSVVSLWYLGLALVASRPKRGRPPPGPYKPLVSVVIAAYNEAAVICRTLTGLTSIRYPYVEVVVVDDGSTDATLQALCDFSASWPPVRIVTQPNKGKAAALNTGFATARGQIVVTVDADTQLDPDALTALVAHFADPRVGAVAGHVKVGNRRNLLTGWQSLEYLTSICVSRVAEGQLNAIMIAPGACAAWRRDVVLTAGGWPGDTLAEDCDLTLAIHRLGYRVEQENKAVAWTEAPLTVRALVRQRIRWTYGNLQAYHKHRDMLFRARFGWLGLLVMPLALIAIVVPLVFLPLTYVMAALSLAGGNWRSITLFTLFVVGVQLVMSIVAVATAHERRAHLLIVPIYRLIWEPLRFVVLYAAAFKALKGRAAGWYRPKRTGTVRAPGAQPIAEPSPHRRRRSRSYERQPIARGGLYRPVKSRAR